MKLIRKHWIFLALILIAVVLLTAFMMNRGDSTQYFTTKAERGDIRDVVEATGTINAVTTVQVGSQVSGTISALYADFNSHVKKGQVVARIDPSIFEGTLLQAKADLENARANASAAIANEAKDRAALAQAQADYERTKSLAGQGIMSQQQLDAGRATADSAVAAVNATKAQVLQANAQVAQKAAAVNVAQTNVDHTIIAAPIDGTVISRNVDVGQTVAASLQAPTLFVIAQDLTKMQVYTNTDESDVGQIRPRQQVTFKVDAFPRDVFQGHVAAVRMNATTVQNVVTYNTVINFDNPDLKLFPGMTAYVTIPVAVARDVLKVPNGALRYKPDMKPDEIRALYAKYGIESGGSGQGTKTRDKTSGGAPAPDQASSGDAMRSRPTASARSTDVGVVWELALDKTLQPVEIRTGITDHTTTEVAQVVKGQLQPGAELVTGSISKSSHSGPPMMGGGPPRGR